MSLQQIRLIEHAQRVLKCTQIRAQDLNIIPMRAQPLCPPSLSYVLFTNDGIRESGPVFVSAFAILIHINWFTSN